MILRCRGKLNSADFRIKISLIVHIRKPGQLEAEELFDTLHNHSLVDGRTKSWKDQSREHAYNNCLTLFDGSCY